MTANDLITLYRMTTTTEIHELTGQLAELVKQVQAGNDVLCTEGNKPVARLVPAHGQAAAVPLSGFAHSKATAF